MLIEDDGISTNGPVTQVRLTLSWTPDEVLVTADISGGFTLPYDQISVRLPDAERRAVQLRCGRDTVTLVRCA